MNKQLRVFFISYVFLLLLSVTSVKAETFYAYLNGAQEVPSVATNATGYARVVLNESAGTISFTVVFRDLSSAQTASHIHAPAPVGMSAGVIINFGTVGGTSGTITGSASITPTQIAQLRAHQGYVNVHSANFSGGEIRGQLGNRRPVDFDGDGRTDFSVLRFPGVSPNTITFYNLNSTSGFQTFVFGNADTDTPTPGDYDGDGKDDFAFYRDGANPGDQSVHMIIKSSDFTLLEYPWGIRGDQPVNRDYDGDGITDAAVFREGATAGQQAVWYIRRSSDGSALIVSWGTTGNGTSTGDVPVPGDYDGDGKFDIAVYRVGISPSNNFIVLQSSNGAPLFVQWGNFTTDYVVPGDYDGDGKFDFAVARTGATGSSNLVWWILQSSNNQARVQSFGVSSDLPVQGDYDGDARTDIAIFRRGATSGSQSIFWTLNSLNSTATATPWGLQSDFPLAAFDVR